MFRRFRAISLAAALAAAVIVPLYGDPRSASITHEEWARMLLRALDLDEALPADAPPRRVFSVLSWRDSLAFEADRYLRADGVRLTETEGGVRRLVAHERLAEVAYPLAVIRSGDYRFRLRLAGNPSSPASAEIVPVGSSTPAGTFIIVPPSSPAWIEAGSAHLDPGPHTASLLLPAGTALEHVEVAPPCLNPVEPPGGWKERAVLKTSHLAVTAVKAVDGEHELPPAAPPINVFGSDFQITSSARPVQVGTPAGLEGSWLVASEQGLQATISVDLPEPGLYTLYVFGVVGEGHSWIADSCRKAVLCPTKEGQQPGWRPVMTAEFQAGTHVFVVTLGAGAAIQGARLERKKDAPTDYIATLARLGFEPGPETAVPRETAVEAMRFVERRRRSVIGGPCGDVVLPPERVETALAQPAQLAGPQPAPPDAGAGPPPLGPAGFPAAEPGFAPLLPPEPPAPGVPPPTAPVPSPPEPAAPRPPRPAPTPFPTPEASPCQPPASPVTPDPCP